ncbi:MAG: tetratricopeptide repeat protein [Acidobacteriota bacterium]|nr:tetratricopeptide repeat protein [Acidobacteriota bacterium]
MAAEVEANFERELKTLRLLIEQTREGVLAFNLYSDVATRNDATAWLQKQSAVPVEIVPLSKGFTDLAEIIRSAPPIPRRCFVFFDIEAGFPSMLGYVNFHREVLLQLGHALVFWIREEGLRRMAEGAPDFWAWSSRVFDFRIGQDVELGQSGGHDAAVGHYSPAQLAKQVQALGESGGSDFVSQLALGRRQLALGRFEESENAFQQAIAEAERQGDQRGLAEALLLIGNSKLAQGLLDEAGPLYRRSFEIATQLGSKEQIVRALGQLSLLAQKNEDPDSAYRLALMMTHIAETVDDPTSLASAYDRLGNVLFSRKDLRGAEQALLTAAKHEEQLNHRSDLAFTLARLGRVYEEMGDVSQAESVLRRAALLFREFGSESEEVQAAAVLQRIGAQYP